MSRRYALVDERRCLQSVIRPFARHVASRKPPQLVVNEGNELVEDV
jgi:hypothetical protein